MKLTRSLVLASLVGALAAGPALAALGGDTASVAADGLHMKAAVRVTAAGSYSVHEIAGAQGTVVREFVGADGKVFAVAWQGPGNPELRQVLGLYYAQYASAVTSGPVNHRHVSVSQPGLVVQNSGRMRSGFTGRAWVPGALPQSFSVADIK